MKGKMTPIKELSIETMIRKLIQEGNPQWSVTKDIGCSQSAVCKIWCKYKISGMVEKEKNILVGHRRDQDRKLNAIYLENRKYATKQIG